MLVVAEGFPTRHVMPSSDGLEGLDFELSRPGAAPPEVIAWIKEHAVPIETVEAGHDFRDLEPLRAIIGNAQVVGLGEATHGTREFFQLKHRLFEFLAREMGFSILAVEARMTTGFDLNDYVLSGRGTPRDALPAFVDSEEMLDALRWMRAYNEDPRHERKVKIYGVDIQPPAPAAARVLEYLRRVDPSGAAVAEAAFGVIAQPATQFGAYDLPPNAQQALRAGVAAVLRALTSGDTPTWHGHPTMNGALRDSTPCWPPRTPHFRPQAPVSSRFATGAWPRTFAGYSSARARARGWCSGLTTVTSRASRSTRQARSCGTRSGPGI